MFLKLARAFKLVSVVHYDTTDSMLLEVHFKLMLKILETFFYYKANKAKILMK